MLQFLLALFKKLDLALGVCWNPEMSWTFFIHSIWISKNIYSITQHNVFLSLDYSRGKMEGMFATWYTFSTLRLRKHQDDNHDRCMVLFLVPKLVARPGKEHQSLCWCFEQPHWWLRLRKLHQSKLSRDHFRALILRFCSWCGRGKAEATVSRKCYTVAAAVHLGSCMSHLCDLGQKTVWPG